MRPDAGGADLLQVARETLTGEVLPALSGAQRYAALMVANALRMVERELAANGRLDAADLAVQAFAGHGGSDDETAARRLCATIRTGRHDADFQLHRALYARVIVAAAITRPDFLTPEERLENPPSTMAREAANGSHERS